MATRFENSAVRLSDLVGDDEVPRLRDAARGREDARYFGLTPYSDQSAEGQFGFFVGIGRLPQSPECVLRVEARAFDDGRSGFRIDYPSLYAACAADPEVSRHLDQCLTVYSDEAPIEVPDDCEWSPLIALAYLKTLRDLVQRHLRRGFIGREDDLRGRVRGQIAWSRYSRSLALGHPEVVPCRFQALEQDTLENRILRTALAGARRLLDGAAGRGLSGREAAWRIWSRQADAALAGVVIARVTPRDFRAARKTGTYCHYAAPLALARAVLTRTGFDPSQPTPPSAARLVPFRLSTAELFERYVEVSLRQLAGWQVWAGYHNQNLPEKKKLGEKSQFLVRPDFLVWQDDRRVIVDAKYKNLYEKPDRTGKGESLRLDVYQTLAYSRHRAVKAKFAPMPPGAPSTIILCYPAQASKDHGSDAKGALKAALMGEKPATFFDFDLPVILFGLTVPAIPRVGIASEA